jgi:1,4-alpha-glucan branching enzyme
VHAIKDGGSRHLLEELAGRIHETKRHVHLILENEENEASRLARHRDGRPLSFTAQWNDDLHHVLHTAATGEISGYYADYAGDTVRLGRTLAEGFGFQGELMPYRGEPRGEPSRDLSPTSFVSFIQNHDQVGNRAFGERLNQLATPEALHAIIAIYLLAPHIPMLFMGEEFAPRRRFHSSVIFRESLLTPSATDDAPSLPGFPNLRIRKNDSGFRILLLAEPSKAPN